MTTPTTDTLRYGTAFDSELLTDPRIDLDMAWSFLDALDPEGLFTFQSFDDTPQKRPGLAKIMHATVRDFLTVGTTLTALNESGAGIFICVNRTDGGGRRNENIVALRALFVDADGIPLPPAWHAPPDMVVMRDDQHWHAYWRLHCSAPISSFKAQQQRLAAFYGTDPSICDPARVMRLPGFLHRKKGDSADRVVITSTMRKSINTNFRTKEGRSHPDHDDRETKTPDAGRAALCGLRGHKADAQRCAGAAMRSLCQDSSRLKAKGPAKPVTPDRQISSV